MKKCNKNFEAMFVFTRVHSDHHWMFKSYFDLQIHINIMEAFRKHRYDYVKISEVCRIPLDAIMEHIQHVIIYIYISCYELPENAFPIPFFLTNGKHVDYVKQMIEELNEAIQANAQHYRQQKKKKHNLHPYFYTTSKLISSPIYTYRHNLYHPTLLNLLGITNDVINEAVEFIHRH